VTPTLGSMVVNGKAPILAFFPSETLLKKVLFPTLGLPTTPITRLDECAMISMRKSQDVNGFLGSS